MDAHFFLWNSPTTLASAATALKDGKVIIGSTDTVFGLMATATAAGLTSLNKIKERDQKPYILLVNSKKMVLNLGIIPKSEKIERLIENCWPGPVTLIFKAAPQTPAFLQAHDGTLAVRIPNHAGLLQLIDQVGPLFSTSANKSGEPVATQPHDLNPHLIEQAACIIIDPQENAGLSAAPQPSTIIDCTQESPKVVRQGAFKLPE